MSVEQLASPGAHPGLVPVRFQCHGSFSSAYQCNRPGDVSGRYYSAESVDELLIGMQAKINMLSGALNNACLLANANGGRS